MHILRFLRSSCVWTFRTIGTGLDFANVSATPQSSSTTCGSSARNGLIVLEIGSSFKELIFCQIKGIERKAEEITSKHIMIEIGNIIKNNEMKTINRDIQYVYTLRFHSRNKVKPMISKQPSIYTYIYIYICVSMQMSLHADHR